VRFDAAGAKASSSRARSFFPSPRCVRSLVVVGDILREQTLQMTLIQCDHDIPMCYLPSAVESNPYSVDFKGGRSFGEGQRLT
jgi:hypothetical protein